MLKKAIYGVLLLSLMLAIACNHKKKAGGKTVYYNLGGEPTTLSPLSSSDAYASEVQGYIFDSLLTRDIETFEWKPALATEWKISDDKRTFDFTLRQGVKWHDGKDFTADDVKFSYDVIFSDDFTSLGLRTYYEAIKSVEVLDKYKVRFSVKDDYYQNFDFCAGIMVMPKHFYVKENKSEWGRKLIGTGPYMLTKYDKGQKLMLAKNPAWWGNTAPEYQGQYVIPKIVLRFAKEENIQLELLKKGDIDFMSFRPEAYIKKTVGKIWDERIVKVKTENKTPKGYTFIAWNFKNPILKDKEVRKALYMLVNRPLMRQKFEYDLSEEATGPVYSQSDYASPDLRPVPYDPSGALKILHQQGWKDTDKNGILDKVINGRKTDLSVTILEPSPDFMKYLTVYKEDASKVGVEINLKNIEWNSFVKLLDEKNFDAVRLAWVGGSVDWDPKQIWHSKSSVGTGSNFISYSNPEVDRLIDQARKIYEKDKRVPLMRRVDELIAKDYPYAFFFNSKYTLYGHSKRIWKPKDTFTYGVGREFWKISGND
jgi:peptide/nickel transport system substrate-binding protein/microcin C transport system substrate-binding protein